MTEAHKTILPNGNTLLIWPDGTSQERDAKGVIVNASLSPARAAELQKLGAQKRWSKEADVDSLLQEAGYTDDNPPPRSISLLAENFAKGGGGAVAAAKEFLRLTRQSDPDVVERVQLQPHEHCPRCGRLGMTLSADMAATIIATIQAGDKPVITDVPSVAEAGSPRDNESAAPTSSTEASRIH